MDRKDGRQRAAPALSHIRSSFMEQPVLIGYMRVSKADGSQALDLQRIADSSSPPSPVGSAPVPESDRYSTVLDRIFGENFFALIECLGGSVFGFRAAVR